MFAAVSSAAILLAKCVPSVVDPKLLVSRTMLGNRIEKIADAIQ
jgi:hypothetical protein